MPENTASIVTVDRWHALWRALGAAQGDAALFTTLLAHYDAPDRHYHTRTHLAECLQEFDHVQTLAQAPAALELALWFHDGHYDPHAHDNEARSAAWAAQAIHAALPAHGAALASRVTELILATQHQTEPDDADARLLCDIDLAILAAAPRRFSEYSAQIRAEYAWVAAHTYRAKRGELLRQLLARDRIYATGYYHTRLEGAARANLNTELVRL